MLLFVCESVQWNAKNAFFVNRKQPSFVNKGLKWFNICLLRRIKFIFELLFRFFFVNCRRFMRICAIKCGKVGVLEPICCCCGKCLNKYILQYV